MSGLAKFIVDSFKGRVGVNYDNKYGIPMTVENGIYYSSVGGQDDPEVSIDWEQLQRDIEVLEKEYNSRSKS